ncbi:MAG: hypothetical protein PHQ43_01040 [Dehalococcoidales bacterium]|nr:hypothetical protein [Dehalococcoidales bacterium]
MTGKDFKAIANSIPDDEEVLFALVTGEDVSELYDVNIDDARNAIRNASRRGMEDAEDSWRNEVHGRINIS